MAASPEAIERVYHERYAGYRSALTVLLRSPDAAHDAVQDGFALALERRRQFRGGSLEAWIWQIVHRRALDRLRGERAVPLEERLEPELVESERDPELARAVRALSPRRRLLVFLRYFADLSYDRIAELTGISAGTVAATLSQAHAELRAQLEPQEVER
jgi:RNA polymerase sigma factor (sigma-70 family)